MSSPENDALYVQNSQELLKREKEWYDALRKKLSQEEKPNMTLWERAVDFFGEENVSEQTDEDPTVSIHVNIPSHRPRLLNIIPDKRLHQAEIFEKGRNGEWNLIDRLEGTLFEEAVVMATRIRGF